MTIPIFFCAMFSLTNLVKLRLPHSNLTSLYSILLVPFLSNPSFLTGDFLSNNDGPPHAQDNNEYNDGLPNFDVQSNNDGPPISMFRHNCDQVVFDHVLDCVAMQPMKSRVLVEGQ